MSEKISNPQERPTINPAELSLAQLNSITEQAEAIRNSDSKTPTLDMRSMLNGELGFKAGHGLTNQEVTSFIADAAAEKETREAAEYHAQLETIVSAADQNSSMADLRAALRADEGFRKIYDMNNLELRAFVESSRQKLAELNGDERKADNADASTEKPSGRHANPSDTAPQSVDGGAADTERRGRHAAPETDVRAEAADSMRATMNDLYETTKKDGTTEAEQEEPAFKVTEKRRNRQLYHPEAFNGIRPIEIDAGETASAPAAEQQSASPANPFEGVEPVDMKAAIDQRFKDLEVKLGLNTREAGAPASSESNNPFDGIKPVGTESASEQTDNAAEEKPAPVLGTDNLRTFLDREDAKATPTGVFGTDRLRAHIDAKQPRETAETEADEKRPSLRQRALKSFRNWRDKLATKRAAKRDQREAYATYEDNIEASRNSSNESDDDNNEEEQRREKGSKKAVLVGAVGSVALIGVALGVGYLQYKGWDMTSGPARSGKSNII